MFTDKKSWRFGIVTLLVLFLLAGSAVRPALATTYVWTDDPSRAPWWTIAVNWDPDGLPGASDDIEFVPGSYDDELWLHGDQACNSITYFPESGDKNWLIKEDTLTLTSGNITFSGGTSSTQDIDSNLTLGGNGTWNVINAHKLNVTGVVSGAFTLTKSGTGTLTLTGDNTYTGNTKVLAGTLIATGSDERIPQNAPVRVDPGATFEVDGIIETIEGLQNQAGSVVLTHGATLRLDPTVLRIFPGSITGATNTTIEKLGNFDQRLDAANPNFSGTTLITGGTIRINDADALQNSTVDIQDNNGLDVTTNSIDATIGALAGSGDLYLGSQELVTGGNGAGTTYSGAITGTSDSILRHNGAGTLTLTGGPSSLGTLRAQSGTVVLDGASIDLNSTDFSASTGALSANSGDITIQNGADVNMAAGSYGLVQNSTLTITGIGSSLTGNRLDAGSYLGNTGSILVEDSASLALDGSLIIGFNGDGDLTVTSGATISATKVKLGITGTASGDATVTGPGSLISSDRLYLGGQSSTSLGGTGTLTVEDGGAVEVTGETKFWEPNSNSSMTIDGGTFETDKLNNYTDVTATVSITDPTGGTALTVGDANGNSTFDGLITDASGAGSIKKLGTGTLTLTYKNTYTGGTTIDGGTLLANNTSNSATGSGDVIINNGATLGGNGNVGGAVTVNAGGTVAPGDSAGKLAVDSVTFTSDSTLAIELGGLLPDSEYDVLMVDGTLSLAYINDFNAHPGDSFVIIPPNGSVVGEFNDVNFPDGQNWTIEYDYIMDKVTVGICTDTDGDGICDADDTPTVHNLTQLTDHFTLQTAIDASVNGDIIEADPGSYNEAINFQGMSITLRSSSGDYNDTIIDGNGLTDYHLIKCINGEDPNTILEGFTITGGNANTGTGNNKYGGGMLCNNSSPTISNCHFTDNQAWSGGALAITNGSSPVIIDALFTNNYADSGGAISVSTNCDLTCTHSRFVENQSQSDGGAIHMRDSNSIIIAHCEFIQNSSLSGSDGGGGDKWS